MRDAYNRPLSDAEKKQLEVDPSFFAEIYIMRADGSGQKRLTTVNGYDGGPLFSPDGTQIVWRRCDEQVSIFPELSLTAATGILVRQRIEQCLQFRGQRR